MLVRRKHRHHPLRPVLAIAVLFLSCYLLAHTINAWVGDVLSIPAHPIVTALAADQPMDAAPSLSTDLGRLLALDILASGLFPVPSSPKATANHVGVSSAPSKASERLALIGTVIGANGSQRAVLEDRSIGKQSLYRVGQQIPDIGDLIAIEKNRVLVRAGLKEEWLELTVVRTDVAIAPPAPEPSQKKPSTHRVMDRMQLVQAAEKPDYYLKETTFHPHINRSGNIEGFRLDGIRPVGVLDNAGLQEDDILSGINGVDMRDPGKLWEMFRQFPHERVIHLNVMRQGEPVTLTVDVRG